MWPIYVTANGELAKAVLDAVASLLNSGSFAAAMKISLVFAIAGTGIGYIRSHDITTFVKSFIIYFIVFSIMCPPFKGMRGTVQVIDLSHPGKANLTVGNIPYGLGMPASIITGIAHALTEAFETAFHLPYDFYYNKTGMLFGSRLFQLSTEFNITSPEVKAELSQYIKNCVIPDVNILKTHTMSEITKSTKLTSTLFQDASNTRGIYIGKNFYTCKNVGGILKSQIQGELNSNYIDDLAQTVLHTSNQDASSAKHYTSPKPQNNAFMNAVGNAASKARYYFSTNSNATNIANNLLERIKGVYEQYNYAKIGSSAQEIATQNLLINALRDGFKAYSAEANDTAGILNFSTSQAMDRMRMNLATSRNMAYYAVPLIHTAVLLLMLGLFPIIILLSIQPSVFGKVIKSYFYGLVWLESWPLMFACLNLIVTYYFINQSGSVAASGLTMENIDLIALEHSDIANMAGYLMFLLPFISSGLIYGLHSVFSSAAQNIGAVFQSSATSAATEAATGNIHLGNVSWGNVSANKLDTNYSVRGGMSTKQLMSGVTESIAADGTPIVDASSATSKLPVNIRLDEMLSESLAKQHREATTAGSQIQQSIDNTTSSAITHLDQFNKSFEHRKNIGDDTNIKNIESYGQDSSNMLSVAKNYSKRTGTSEQDSLRKLTEAFASIPFAKLVGTGTSGRTASEAVASYLKGQDINLSAEEIKKFSEGYNHLKSFDASQHAGQMDAQTAQQLSGISAELRKVESYSQHKSSNLSRIEGIESAMAYTKQNSSLIHNELVQPFVEDLRVKVGADEANRLAAGRTIPDQMKLRGYAQDFVSRINIAAQHSKIPEQSDIVNNYKAIENQEINLGKRYNGNKEVNHNQAAEAGILTEKDINKKYQNIINQEIAGRNYIDKTLADKQGEVTSEISQLEKDIKEKQKQGKVNSEQSVTQSLTEQVKNIPRWGGEVAVDSLIGGVSTLTGIKNAVIDHPIKTSVETVVGSAGLIVERYGKHKELEKTKEEK